ncbi:hypothetical protein ABEX25_11270 [Paenibacillus thiaminolyticus]|uniref:hypothetical protein n=1 Tax=Paenibacillus thiaminolyticus TaxID=49283 RepID=UPI003D27011C
MINFRLRRRMRSRNVTKPEDKMSPVDRAVEQFYDYETADMAADEAADAANVALLMP